MILRLSNAWPNRIYKELQIKKFIDQIKMFESYHLLNNLENTVRSKEKEEWREGQN
jgi:hypothetical protein